MAINISLTNKKLRYYSLHNITFKNVTEKEINELYEMVSDQLYEIQASLISATITGDRSAAKTVKKASKKVFDEINWPVMWIGDKENTLFSGSFIAVSGVNIKTLCGNGFTTKYFETASLKYCFVGDVIFNSISDKDTVNDLIQSAMNLVGVNAENMVRRWNFTEVEMGTSENWENISGSLFNDDAEKENALTTLIGTSNQHKKAGIISALALQQKSDGLKATVADEGGHKSNAILIENEDSKSLYVSGLNIKTNDHLTENTINITEEIEQGLLQTEELLLANKLGWKDLFRGTVYLKNLTDVRIFKQVCKEKKIPLAPIIFVQVNRLKNNMNFDIELDFISSYEN